MGIRLHLELAETDVPELVGRGWLWRDADPRSGVVQVRFTQKGMAEIIAIGAVSADGCTVIGFRDDVGRQWVIGRVERRSWAEKPPVFQ